MRFFCFFIFIFLLFACTSPTPTSPKTPKPVFEINHFPSKNHPLITEWLNHHKIELADFTDTIKNMYPLRNAPENFVKRLLTNKEHLLIQTEDNEEFLFLDRHLVIDENYEIGALPKEAELALLDTSLLSYWTLINHLHSSVFENAIKVEDVVYLFGITKNFKTKTYHTAIWVINVRTKKRFCLRNTNEFKDFETYDRAYEKRLKQKH